MKLTQTVEVSAADARGLTLIAIFKLVKGMLLLSVSIGALKLLHKDVAEAVMRWVNILHVDPDNHFVHGLITRATSIGPMQLRELSAGTFLYSILLNAEGGACSCENCGPSTSRSSPPPA